MKFLSAVEVEETLSYLEVAREKDGLPWAEIAPRLRETLERMRKSDLFEEASWLGQKTWAKAARVELIDIITRKWERESVRLAEKRKG